MPSNHLLFGDAASAWTHCEETPSLVPAHGGLWDALSR